MYNFEMHFIDRIDWAGCVLADGSEACCASLRIDGISIATWASFAKRLLTQVLAGCWDRIERRPEEFTIRRHEYEHLDDPLQKLFGRKAGIHFLKLIAESDLAEIKRLSSSYRIRLVLRALAPGTGVRLSRTWLSGKCARLFGNAQWSAPCLFIIWDLKSKESIDVILAQATAQLGFGRLHVLPPDSKLTKRRELLQIWRVRVSRSLFQLVICPVECTDDMINKTVSRVGLDAAASGVWVATGNTFQSVLENIRNNFPSAQILDISNETNAGTKIAHAYLGHLKNLGSQQY
jgi:hypothetical protein